MAAPPLSNTFESGQADTTTITVGNSDGGAGDAFDAFFGTAPTYSTEHVKAGSLSMKVDATSTVQHTAAWTALGSIAGSVYYRFYLYMTAYPVATSPRLVSVRTSSALSAAISMRRTNEANPGAINPMNAASTGLGNGTVPAALNQWVRIEARILSSTTVGEFEWWLYNTPEASIASFDDHAAATGLVLGANTDQVRWGAAESTGPTSWVIWMDDIAVSTSGQIGPSGTTDTGLAWLRA